METFTEKYYIAQWTKANKLNLALTTLLIISLVIHALVSSLFFIRLNDSRVVITCASFSSYGEAYTFVQNHLEYAKRLDRNNNGEPCQNDYGNL